MYAFYVVFSLSAFATGATLLSFRQMLINSVLTSYLLFSYICWFSFTAYVPLIFFSVPLIFFSVSLIFFSVLLFLLREDVRGGFVTNVVQMDICTVSVSHFSVIHFVFVPFVLSNGVWGVVLSAE